MTIEKIYYRKKPNINTRDDLREIAIQDQNYIKHTLTCYQQLQDCEDIDPLFREWFTASNARLPKQPRERFKHNSPKTFCEGVVAKLNQAQNRRDLSPQVCVAIEELTEMMAGLFDVPVVKFKEKGTEETIPPTLTKLFK